ncbi:MAG: nickel-type superoxide dismutase maturation protease [Streptosporangiaceae bacterium]
MRLPFLVARAEGLSMWPALRPGDILVIRRASRPPRPRDIVVVHRPDRPGLLVTKRVVRRERRGWWLEGDNPGHSDDSRVFGAVPDKLVVGRVVWRIRPRRGRRIPRPR